jgi:hypothetical protein
MGVDLLLIKFCSVVSDCYWVVFQLYTLHLGNKELQLEVILVEM